MDLRNAALQYADLRDATLPGVVLQGADLFGAVMDGANLVSADLQFANGTLVSLIGADLSGASLSDSSFAFADFTNADLNGTNFVGANLYSALYDEETVFPSGGDLDSGNRGLPGDATPRDLLMVPAPEPASALMLAVGSLTLGLIGRYRSERRTRTNITSAPLQNGRREALAWQIPKFLAAS